MLFISFTLFAVPFNPILKEHVFLCLDLDCLVLYFFKQNSHK